MKSDSSAIFIRPLQTAMTPARDNVNSTASVQLAGKLSVNASICRWQGNDDPCDEHIPHYIYQKSISN